MKRKEKSTSEIRMPKDLIADIRLFEVLYREARAHGITLTDWARAAWPDAKRNQQPRISELKRISDLVRGGMTQEAASVKVKRSCTILKIAALEAGLMRLTENPKIMARLEKLKRSPGKPTDYDRKVTFMFVWNHLPDKDKDDILSLMLERAQA